MEDRGRSFVSSQALNTKSLRRDLAAINNEFPSMQSCRILGPLTEADLEVVDSLADYIDESTDPYVLIKLKKPINHSWVYVVNQSDISQLICQGHPDLVRNSLQILIPEYYNKD